MMNERSSIMSLGKLLVSSFPPKSAVDSAPREGLGSNWVVSRSEKGNCAVLLKGVVLKTSDGICLLRLTRTISVSRLREGKTQQPITYNVWEAREELT